MAAGHGPPAGGDNVPDSPELGFLARTGPAPALQSKMFTRRSNGAGWQDFGTGALAITARHTRNMPFRALKLGYPTEIKPPLPASTSNPTNSNPNIRFHFPERDGLAALNFHWHDGGNPLPDNPTKHDGKNKTSQRSPPRSKT